MRRYSSFWKSVGHPIGGTALFYRYFLHRPPKKRRRVGVKRRKEPGGLDLCRKMCYNTAHVICMKHAGNGASHRRSNALRCPFSDRDCMQTELWRHPLVGAEGASVQTPISQAKGQSAINPPLVFLAYTFCFLRLTGAVHTSIFYFSSLGGNEHTWKHFFRASHVSTTPSTARYGVCPASFF